MADVMTRLEATADRGQLLLVTALALAVLLVTVALLLNAAIFTENVATRDTTADGAEAIELRGELVDSIGGLIETENRAGSGSTASVDNGVDAIGPMADRERGRDGAIATLDRNGAARAGKLLRWNPPSDDRRFDINGTNWTLVDGMTDARGFRLALEPTSLTNTNAATSDTDAFGVRFNSSSGENVTLYIYADDSETLSVAQSVEGSTPVHQCSIEHNGTTTVDLTGDRLSTNGSQTDCFRGLWPDNSPESIEFVNADAARGTLDLTVDDGATPSSESELQVDDAVYSVTVDIGYQTADLEFETTVTVAPGEPR